MISRKTAPTPISACRDFQTSGISHETVPGQGPQAVVNPDRIGGQGLSRGQFLVSRAQPRQLPSCRGGQRCQGPRRC
jgi:hypothetical protein